MATFFDDMEEGQANTPSKAFWEVNWEEDGDEEFQLNWLKGELDYLVDESYERIQNIKRNIALFKGIQYQTQTDRSDIRDRSDDRSRIFQKITVNHLFDLTEQRVSALVKYKPGVAILPNNDEFNDKIAAKMTKMLLEHIWYKENFEGLRTRLAAKMATIQGEAYMFVDWDPNKGDVHPEYEAAEKEAEKEGFPKVPLKDENGAVLKDDDGKTVFIEEQVRVGDVCYDLVSPFNVFLQNKERWEDVDYLFRRKRMHISEARARWPKKAHKIKANEEKEFYNWEKMNLEPAKERVEVWELFHRRTDIVDKGRRIFFTRDTVLSSGPAPYSHRKLNCVRLTDVELPNELHAVSFFQMIKHLTGAYNNLTNMILRNQIFVSHPKWFVPAGSVKMDSLGNDISIVQYKGPSRPELVQANPTGRETYEFRQSLKEEFQQLSGVFGVSRGEPPAGIKAGVALQFLAEQENERRNEAVLKFNEWIRETAWMTLAVAGDYYDASDNRMIRVMGKENEYMNEFFDAFHLSRPYDVKIQTASALPSSKAARLQTLIDLHREFPNEVQPKQVLELLDLAQSDKFIDIATSALRMAEAENEKITQGKDVPEAEEYEDHIEHWKVHVRHLQSLSFKLHTPEKQREALIDHITTHEMMMVEAAQTNMLMQKELAVLRQFPIFYEPPVLLPPAAEGLPQGDQGMLGQPAGFAQAEAAEQEINSPGMPPIPTPQPAPAEPPVQNSRSI
jgi:hypothetical protein